MSPGFRSMPSYTCPILPDDVMAEIVDTFALQNLNNIEKIKTLSYVSPFCLYQCRKYIFRTIRVGYRRGLSLPSIANFVRLVLDHPHVASYIRNLSIYLSTAVHDPFIQQNLLQALSVLTSLSSVRISGSTLNRTAWMSLPDPIRSSFSYLLSYPTLTSIDIEYFEGFPLTLLKRSSGLRRLNLHKAQLQSTHPGGSSCDEKATERNVLSHYPHVKLPLSRLQTLFFGVEHADDIENIIETLNQHGASMLETLSIDMQMALPTGAGSYDNNVSGRLIRLIKPHSSTLKDLTLYTSLSLLTQNPYGDLCPALEELEHYNTLQSLTIHTTVQENSLCTMGREWAALPNVLLMPGWKALKKVEIVVVVKSSQYMGRTGTGTDVRKEQIFDLRYTHLAPLFTQRHPFCVEFRVLLSRASRVVEASVEVGLKGINSNA